MSTRGPASPSRAAIRRVASMPSISGMRMSMRTTSGVEPARAVDGLRAVGALAHDLHVLLGVEDHPEAGADQRLVVHEQHADAHAGTSCGSWSSSPPGTSGRVGSRARTAKPPSGPRPGLHDAPVHRGALAHAHEPVAAAGAAQLVVVARPLAVVLDAQHELVRLVRDRDAGARARRVLERVGERLLDDPVRGQVDPGRQLDGVAGHAQLHAQARPRARGAPARRRARCSAAPDSGSAPPPRRTGPNRCRISASASRPVRSISAAASTARSGFFSSTWRAARGLDHHHAQVVREHVVQLARDAAALERDRAPLVLLARVLRALRLLGELAREHASGCGSSCPASHGHDPEERDREEDVVRVEDDRQRHDHRRRRARARPCSGARPCGARPRSPRRRASAPRRTGSAAASARPP